MNFQSLGLPWTRYTFRYASWKTATVTVYAFDFNQAVNKAKKVMDKRYEKQDREPPVAWTLTLIASKYSNILES
jgi:hypothetical protein